MDAANTGNILARDVEDGTGNTPFVTASGVNNGVAAYIDASKYEIIEGNCILVGGKTFTLTYQKDDFVSNDSHNIVIRFKNENISKFHYLYLISILRATLGTKYFWGDAVTKEKILADSILLPQASDGNPDWAYMERYMRAMEQKAMEHIEDLLRDAKDIMQQIDTLSFREFVVGDLFRKLDLKTRRENFNKRLDTSAVRTKEFNLPLVNAKDGNNGIMYYGRKEDFDNEKLCIDIVQNGAVATGNVYVQEESTGVLWDAYLIKPLAQIGKYALLYVATILRKVLKEEFSYENKAIWDKVKEVVISLPQATDGNPDWAYMERYMRSVEAEARKRLQSLGVAIESVRFSLTRFL